MLPSELLDAAADRLERTGWIQHTNGDRDGPNCANGALYWEIRMNLSPVGVDRQRVLLLDEARAALSTVIINAPRPMLSSVINAFNDRPGQTAENVIATMRKAADSARSAGR